MCDTSLLIAQQNVNKIYTLYLKFIEFTEFHRISYLCYYTVHITYYVKRRLSLIHCSLINSKKSFSFVYYRLQRSCSPSSETCYASWLLRQWQWPFRTSEITTWSVVQLTRKLMYIDDKVDETHIVWLANREREKTCAPCE